MKTPSFWQKNSWLSKLLAPVAWIYGGVTQLRLKFCKPHRVNAKVICVGNITAGGVGKTPIAQAVARHYLEQGKKVFFLTRGYKGHLKNIVVDLSKHTPYQTGDEARLLALIAPTIIAPNRAQGAEMAVKLGAEVIVMDDGFQNPSLFKDESWLVFDGAKGMGNGHILPAGPLRETLANGQKRATRIVIVGEDKTRLAEKCALPVCFANIEAEPLNLPSRRVFAFAGIGHPEKFYQTLRSCGYEVVKTKNFADHYAYHQEEVATLKAEAAAAGLILVTTEKDFVKIGDPDIYVLKIRAKLADDVWVTES